MKQLIQCSVVMHLLSTPLMAQEMADAYYDAEEMARARHALKHHHGDHNTYLVSVDRSEYQSRNGDAAYVWDGQGWYGNDLHKIWIKTEAEYDFEEDELEELELQALYSRAISPFWDLQAGFRHDIKPDPSRTYATVGFQGLAPYWFEIDANTFISEKGDISLRLEAEYEIRLSQQLILQPRMEMNVAFSDDEAIHIGRGLSQLEAGVRLRYELTREIAPYIGINWSRAYGETADLLGRAGQGNESRSLVAGIRFWY